MRTKTTKQIETMTFERLSSWSIIMGAGKELYHRYDAEIWAVIAFGELAIIIFNKLGR